MTVRRLREELTHWEWLLWTRYYMRIQQAQELAAATQKG